MKKLNIVAAFMKIAGTIGLCSRISLDGTPQPFGVADVVVGGLFMAGFFLFVYSRIFMQDS